MARKTVVILTDDIDGGDADRTVKFSFDGSDYEIDLNHSNLDTLATALAPFIKVARNVGKRRTPRAGGQGDNPAKARAWAQANGFTISDKGRVPAEIMTAYQQHN